MPSVSSKQKRFMQAVSHDKAFAEKVDVPQSVGKDFEAADKGKPVKKKSKMERLYKDSK